MMLSIRHISNFASVALLALLLLAIVPKQLWHHCELNTHHDNTTNGDIGDHAFIENNCPICDFQFLPPFHTCEYKLFPTSSHPMEEMVWIIPAILDTDVPQNASRGPPLFS